MKYPALRALRKQISFKELSFFEDLVLLEGSVALWGLTRLDESFSLVFDFSNTSSPQAFIQMNVVGPSLSIGPDEQGVEMVERPIMDFWPLSLAATDLNLTTLLAKRQEWALAGHKVGNLAYLTFEMQRRSDQNYHFCYQWLLEKVA